MKVIIDPTLFFNSTQDEALLSILFQRILLVLTLLLYVQKHLTYLEIFFSILRASFLIVNVDFEQSRRA